MKAGFKLLLSSLFMAILFLFACRPGQFFAPTGIPTFTKTPTQIPTTIPPPTGTIPPTLAPTPAFTSTAIPALGTPIASDDWEVTVVGALTHDRLAGDPLYDRPEKGYIFVDVGVKIKNLDPEKNDLLLIRNALIFEIFDHQGKPIELYKYGVAAQEINPLFIPLRWTPDIKQVKQVFYHYGFILSVSNIDLQEQTTTSIRLILNAGEAVISSPFLLQFQDLPLIQFAVEQ